MATIECRDTSTLRVAYRVLVVEDDLELRLLTLRALQREEIQCDSAANGLDAIRMAECTRYDLVVSDMRMPKLPGRTLVLDLLRRDDPPLVVVLTSVLDQKLAQDLLSHGVEGIAFKPVNLASFAARVKRILIEKVPACRTVGV